MTNAILGSCLAFSAGLNVLGSDLTVYERNWPQWRGPTANGVILRGNPPIEWGEGKNVRWKVPVPGEGHATPIIWEEKIFLLTAVPVGADIEAVSTGATPEGGRGGRGGDAAPSRTYAFTTLCLDRASGRTLWSKVGREEVPHEGRQGSNTYASGSAVTDGERVVAFHGSRGLYCYDLEGNLLWEKDLGRMRTRNGFGEGTSPAMGDGVVVVVWDTEDDSWVSAFDKVSGKELWKQVRDEPTGWTTPYILEYEGQRQVVINGAKAVRSYDLDSGRLLWECSGQTLNAIPSIVGDADTVYAMSGFRGNAAFAIQLGGTGDLTGTPAVRWSLDRGTPYVPSPLLMDGRLYFCQRTDGLLTCVEAATGKVLYSQERLSGISGVYASPVGVGDRVILPGRNGMTAVVAQGPTFKVLAMNQLDEPIDASPAVVGDELFLRGHQHLYCIASEAN